MRTISSPLSSAELMRLRMWSSMLEERGGHEANRGRSLGLLLDEHLDGLRLATKVQELVSKFLVYRRTSA